MEIISWRKLSELYQSNPEFRASLQKNPVEALTLWQIADEPQAQLLVNNNKWLADSPKAICVLIAQGGPMNWLGPVPIPPISNMLP